MACPIFKEKISSYLDGMLGPDGKAEVENHLKSCGRCREYYDEISRSVETVRGLDDIEPPPWLKQRVMAKIRAEKGQRVRSWKDLFRPLRIRIPVGAVAMLAVAVITVYIFRSVGHDIRVAEVSQEEAPVRSVPQDAERTDEGKRPSAEPEQRVRGRDALRLQREKTLPAPLLKETVTLPQAAPEARLQEEKPQKKDAPALISSGGLRPAGEPAERPTAEDRPAAVRELQERKKVASPAPAAMPSKEEASREGTARSAGAIEQDAAMRAPEAPAEMPRRQESLTVVVEDAARDIERIKQAIRSLGGTLISEESLDDKKVVLLKISSRQYKDLLERLCGIGEIGWEHAPEEGPTAWRTVRIEVLDKRR